MTVRRRLVVLVLASFVVVIVAAGVVSVVLLKNRLIAEVDRTLADRIAFVEIAAGTFPFDFVAPPPPASPFLTGREFAIIALDASGATLLEIPSGSDEAPDPLPALTETAIAQLIRTDEPLTLEGEVPYRVSAVSLDIGVTLVLAIPLEATRSAIASAIGILVIVGAIAGVALGGLVWLIIRRSLLPLAEMSDTTDRISGGSLTERVEVSDPGNEIGRLGTAVNSMLERIEVAVDARAESEDRMREFVADASHELRTPLTSIRGYAELYRAGATSPEHVARSFERIGHEAERMGALVDDLVLLARLDRERTLERAPVDIGALVDEVARDARAADSERTLIVEKTDGLIVNGDADRIRQVLVNLLANVLAHTPLGTPASLVARRNGDSIVVEVADEGPGMDPASADRVFERFYQVNQDRSGPGSGLGLSIARSIVQAHGGDVALESTPGQGTTVTVRFPTGNGSP